MSLRARAVSNKLINAYASQQVCMQSLIIHVIVCAVCLFYINKYTLFMADMYHGDRMKKTPLFGLLYKPQIVLLDLLSKNLCCRHKQLILTHNKIKLSDESI